ncbi:putative protein of unknown function (DUF4490) [Monocercomonoides exilis]|uniref:putative protein of unknown function (DUF4490) n=1 Tax=Monocercomonoides exilis TaxID=2049356 RepID=UPI00355A9C49|nr:putative protein of unknown function (DUF4490) [Monocercomonoides exilis]|eukprot:MONOS_5836.1-p1 / transcript=MONOS_5836.1 / gene=MONOS_5836 / organism=Monocercomonoides_exilis_PA203 / gene_product=unspecified product / transcript_product=unspecified product / location=Mono_scaffold00175:55001-55614(-) / protein_length=132 / sequence_SO=supercontig / SO=protein_coding / is_pseudo=false
MSETTHFPSPPIHPPKKKIEEINEKEKLAATLNQKEQKDKISTRDFGTAESPESTLPIRFRGDNLKYQPVKQHPLYRTSNSAYGHKVPEERHMPSKYVPKGTSFVKSFTGGFTASTALNTSQTRSRYVDIPE